MDVDAFKVAYGSLNAAQKQAVDTIDGPVMVIAGPGTGKTQILALRIANILLKTDTKPEHILALTFTDAGVHAMKERLRHFIGEAAYKIAVHTFHSFASELIRHYPDCYPAIIGGRPATDIERFSILEDIINTGAFQELRPSGDPLYYVKRLPTALADLKKEYVTPEILGERTSRLEEQLAAIPQLHEKGVHKGKVRSEYAREEKRIKKLKELLLAYRLYQSALHERRLFDFEDMIVETVAALTKHEGMLRDLQETYQYILADEHQDVNESQNKILESLAHFHDRPNIFVVGDEKQSIYRFQGASLDNFLYFEDRFPGTTAISLAENYRSTQAILDIAHELIKSDDPELAKLRVPLQAANPKFAPAGSKIGTQEIRRFSHEAVEDEWLVSEVQARLQSGVLPEEIAVIVRYNRDVEHFASLLRQHHIDISASAESDILDHPITKAVENLLRATLSPSDDMALFDTLLGGWWGIDSGDLALIFAARGYGRPLWKLIGEEKLLQEIRVRDPAAFFKIAEILQQTRIEATIKAPHLVLQYLLEQSGLLAHILTIDPIESVRVLRRLYDDIEAMVIENQATTLPEVVAQLRYRRQHSLPLSAPFIDADQTAVRVLTAHKAKGLEFHTVFLPRATDSAFGKAVQRDLFKLPLSLRSDSNGDDHEDDRRLFYVALTRAKQDLLISSAATSTSGKIAEPTRFLEGLGDIPLSVVAVDDLEEAFRPETRLLGRPVQLDLSPKLIKQLFLARGLSVTHLNNYLEDPLKYFYENLLRRPQPQSLSLMKGNAVHDTLERIVVEFIASAQWASVTDIGQYLTNALERLPIGVHDFTDLHARALAALTMYLPHLTGIIDSKSRPELSIKVNWPTLDPDLPEIPLTGKIDRLDYNEAGQVIRIVDYKTGKPKSRNVIEGKTKDGNGNYKRQLVFYALLLELYGIETKDPEFVLSFVEPKERTGEIVEHAFSIQKAEIEDLKQEILRVSKEIISGEKF